MRAKTDSAPLRLRIRRCLRRRLAAVLAGILAALLGLSAAPAFAEKADRNKPINIEADRMQHDDLKQITVFTGSVVLTKGTILLRADKLVLRQDPEGYQYGTATGNLAFFKQKREGVDQYVEGQARQIDYDGKLETFHLQQQAMLRRTEKDRVVDEVHGSDILYESRSEFFTVEGTSGAAATAGNPAGRVRVVIQPREGGGAADNSAPPGSAAGGGAAAGGAAAPGEATTLQPAERLGTPRGAGAR